MNQYEFVLGIILIVMVASIFKARYRHRLRDEGQRPDDGEAMRLREEVKQLKERLQVLERIATDKENSLSREIEELRDQ